jgi:hypothetical protein
MYDIYVSISVSISEFHLVFFVSVPELIIFEGSGFISPSLGIFLEAYDLNKAEGLLQCITLIVGKLSDLVAYLVL